MQRIFIWVLLVKFFFICQGLIAQRIVAECTVDFRVQPDSNWKDAGSPDFNAIKRVFIKGNDLRIDMENPGFLQSLIYDKANQQATVLRIIGTNKFITRLEGNDWQQELKKYDSMQVDYLNAYKNIIGYDCKSLSLKLKDGTDYLVYYTTSIAPSVREFELAFKDIPGFVLQYSVTRHNHRVTYQATRISFSPVPASRFDEPTKGFRILQK
jgi:hypothetical protein